MSQHHHHPKSETSIKDDNPEKEDKKIATKKCCVTPSSDIINTPLTKGDLKNNRTVHEILQRRGIDSREYDEHYVVRPITSNEASFMQEHPEMIPAGMKILELDPPREFESKQ